MCSSDAAAFVMAPGSSSNFLALSKLSETLSSGIPNFEVNLKSVGEKDSFRDDGNTVLNA